MHSLVLKEAMSEESGKERRKTYVREPEREQGKTLQVQEREEHMLYNLYLYRVMDTNQILKLYGIPKERSCSNRIGNRLTRLFDAGYVDRFANPYFRAPGTGTWPAIYALYNRGAKRVAQKLKRKNGFDYLTPSLLRSDWKERNEDIINSYIPHRLMIAEFMINVELMTKAVEGLKFVDRLEVVRDHTTEYHEEERKKSNRWQEGWLPTPEKEKELQEPRLEPDQVFILERKIDGREATSLFFLEADQDTETQYARIGSKLRRYRISARDEVVENHYRTNRFHVLVVTIGNVRAENMVKVSRAINKEVTGNNNGWARFLFTTEGQINKTLEAGGTLIDAPWLNGRGDLVTLRQILYPEQAPEPELPGEVFSGR